MKVAFFSAKPYERPLFEEAAGEAARDFTFFEPRLTPDTAPLARDFEAVCIFVNDEAGAPVLKQLARGGVKLLALRAAGFNNVDLRAAEANGITVVRVPAYSPFAPAEHAVALMLSLNRKIFKAYNRVREGNFALDGLMGFDMHGKTAGIAGTGKIGAVVACILRGFGCRLLAYDVQKNPRVEELGAEYVAMPRLLAESDIITLHVPLTPQTHHMINGVAVDQMKRGAMLINTSRGGLVDTPAVIDGLKTGQIGALGLDVYEEEEGLFFEDLSGAVLQDDTFARLLTFPNVVVTSHQGFFTREAIQGIVRTTLDNLREFQAGRASGNEVQARR